MVIGDEGGKSSSRILCLAVGSDWRGLLYGEVTSMVSLWNFYVRDKCILSLSKKERKCILSYPTWRR